MESLCSQSARDAEKRPDTVLDPVQEKLEKTAAECTTTTEVDIHIDSQPNTAYDQDENNHIHTSSSDAQCLDATLGDGVTKKSKNQIKKELKKERWLQVKAERRQAEKEKKKRRFAEMRERGEVLTSRKSLKRNRMQDSRCRQRVAIDCSFDSFMSDKDINFLVQQIQHSYAANRRADNPLQLYVCGINHRVKKRLDSIGDYKGWDVFCEERDYLGVFPKQEVVYLSSESPHVLERLDESKVYIIGGLVDHNHHKGLCHQLAEEKGLQHAQLPIAQFLKLKSRKVLTINHVFEILLRYSETQDWQKAFLSVLPQRKGASAKDHTEDGSVEPQTAENQEERSEIEEKKTGFKGDANSHCETESGKDDEVHCEVESEKDAIVDCETDSKEEVSSHCETESKESSSSHQDCGLKKELNSCEGDLDTSQVDSAESHCDATLEATTKCVNTFS